MVFIRNEGLQEAQVLVEMTDPGQFSYRGMLAPGEQVSHRAEFAENSFKIECRDQNGAFGYGDGYVTNGVSFIATITIDGCDTVSLNLQSLP